MPGSHSTRHQHILTILLALQRTSMHQGSISESAHVEQWRTPAGGAGAPPFAAAEEGCAPDSRAAARSRRSPRSGRPGAPSSAGAAGSAFTRALQHSGSRVWAPNMCLREGCHTLRLNPQLSSQEEQSIAATATDSCCGAMSALLAASRGVRFAIATFPSISPMMCRDKLGIQHSLRPSTSQPRLVTAGSRAPTCAQTCRPAA